MVNFNGVGSTATNSGNPANPFLMALGNRVRRLRERNSKTRKALASSTGISERHLANLEYGEGNVSILVLMQIAEALKCPPAQLIGDITTSSTEWLKIRSLLQNCDSTLLQKAHAAIAEAIGSSSPQNISRHRFALIGLRGAGKTALGEQLADDLGYAFVEISREIEKLAGCTIAEILDLYGAAAYRRHERRALEQIIQLYPQAVIATPGGLVSEQSNYEFLLKHCTTIWLKASPQDHMNRVIAQGDLRPMGESSEAMQDLEAILASRKAAYSQADFQLDTSQQSLPETFEAMRRLIGAELRI